MIQCMMRSSLTLLIILLCSACGAPQRNQAGSTPTSTDFNDAQYRYPDYYTYQDYDDFYRNIEDPYVDYDTTRLPRNNEGLSQDPQENYYGDNDEFYYPQYYYY